MTELRNVIKKNLPKGFEEIITADPEDHTAHFFMENALKYCENGVPENWTGVETANSK